MASVLKTDYKDAVFSGDRKYRQTSNADGTVSLEDVTDYSTEGDRFSAHDVNAITRELNAQGAVRTIAISVANFSNTVPYTLTVNVSGITANDTPVVGFAYRNGDAANNVKARSRAFSCVDRIVTNNGSITLYCYSKKPVADFDIFLKGV